MADFCGHGGWGPFRNGVMTSCFLEVVISGFPVLFLFIFGSLRFSMIRHVAYNAGPAKWPFKHLLKRVICMFMMALCLLIALMALISDRATVYIVLYVAHTVAWGLSLFILRAEYRRCLPQTWLGLRSFWVLSFFAAIAKLIWLGLHGRDEDEAHFIVQLSIHLVGFIPVSILAVLVWFPRDVNLDVVPYTVLPPWTDDIQSGSPRIWNRWTQPANRMTMPLLSDDDRDPQHVILPIDHRPVEPKIDLNQLVVAVPKWKMAVIGPKTIVVYKVRVEMGGKGWSLSKRYSEFKQLHQQLAKIFSSNRYPELAARLPRPPPKGVFTQLDPDFLETRRRGLESYLQALVQPPHYDFLCVALCSFLKIEGEVRDILMSQKKQKDKDTLLNSSYEEDSRLSLATQLDTSRISALPFPDDRGSWELRMLSEEAPPPEAEDSHVQIEIPRWQEVLDPTNKPYITYIVEIQTPQGHFTRARRFREFDAFYRRLKEISFVRLPPFPSKSISQLQPQDSAFFDLRQSKLEFFMKKIAANLSVFGIYLYEFLDLDVTDLQIVDEMFKDKEQLAQDELYTCYTICVSQWSGRVDRYKKAYVVYTLEIEKIVKEKETRKWTLRKRFREFYNLYQQLQRRFARSTLKLPEFPSRGLGPTADPAALETRRIKLEQFMCELLAYPGASRAPEFKLFIAEPKPSTQPHVAGSHSGSPPAAPFLHSPTFETVWPQKQEGSHIMIEQPPSELLPAHPLNGPTLSAD
eukprot:GILJ01004381.1.p1 GENE.GILJ01004381.1~~GILJ01004381.1.p1  ORF type:complete len:747 (+),score=97.25 GILJ01004381.1:106-2346(+)